jgi:hypothetical protein
VPTKRIKIHPPKVQRAALHLAIIAIGSAMGSMIQPPLKPEFVLDPLLLGWRVPIR